MPVAGTSPTASKPTRLTRALLLEELERVTQAIGVYALAKRMEARLGRRVSANSVYRILAALEGSDEALRIETAKAWICARGDAGPALRLVCSRCTSILSLAAPEITGGLSRLAARAAYRPTRLVLEVIGLCDRCTAEPSADAAPA